MNSIILFFAIFFSIVVTSRTINSYVLIIRTGQPREDADVGIFMELLTSIFWAIFYYLTH